MEDVHSNHRERMRDRITMDGVDNMQEHEILEYLLYPFIPRKDTNPIAHDLITKFGSLASVLESDADIVEDTPNMTANAAHFLTSLPGIYKRYEVSKFGAKPKLSSFEEIRNYAKALLQSCNEEHMYLLAIDNSGRLITKCELGDGSISDCRVQTRKLVLMCHNLQTPNVYLLHNHPSGKAYPSMKDIDFTKWAVIALETLGVSLVDHLIVAKNEIYSFAKNGQLEGFRHKYFSFMTNEGISDIL